MKTLSNEQKTKKWKIQKSNWKESEAKFLNFYNPENLNENSFIAESKEKEKDDRQGLNIEKERSNECEANDDKVEKWMKTWTDLSA